MLVLFTAAAVAAADQITKFLVVRAIPLGQSRVIWPKIFAFTHVRNAGAAFGILQCRTWLFIVIAAAVVAAAVYFWRRIQQQPFLVRLGAGLALGGTIGNLIDRIWLAGRVRDFLDFYFWPVFNLADVGLFCGVCLIVGALILAGKPAKNG